MRTLQAALAALALAWLSRAAVGGGLLQGPWRAPAERLGDRYAPLLAALPPGRDLGYLSDVPASGDPTLRFRARRALAPRLLHEGTAWPQVVADLADPGRLDALAAAHGLRVAARFPGGVALLEPVSP